ncbi:hypothetical protein LBMAG29_09500 [Methylophilaceae bacterium]|nr:hypothetical protein LBMAG29_09500 [Methylophilaceae bacterium]
MIIKESQVFDSLQNLGIQSGDSLMVHSFIGAFGRIDGGPEVFINALLKILGHKGTLIVPTYNYDFCSGKTYDPKKSPSQVGQLSEYFRKLSSTQRSFHPVYSHAVMGAKQKFYCQNPSSSAFGEDSFFSKLFFDKAKLLFMGVDFQVATIIHYVEEKFTVPYRFMKEFSGKVVEDDTEKDFTARIYSRDLELDPKLNTKKLQDFLIQNGVAKESVLGRGKLMSVGVLEFCDCVLSFLQKNPYNLAEVSKS